jgi:hypothetical protein
MVNGCNIFAPDGAQRTNESTGGNKSSEAKAA